MKNKQTIEEIQQASKKESVKNIFKKMIADFDDGTVVFAKPL